MSSFNNQEFDLSAFINSPLTQDPCLPNVDDLNGAVSMDQSASMLGAPFMDTRNGSVDTFLTDAADALSASLSQQQQQHHQQAQPSVDASYDTVPTVPNPAQVYTGWDGYDQSQMSAPAPMETNAPSVPATSIPDGTDGQLDRKALAYSAQVAAHHSEKLRAVLPSFAGINGGPGGGLGGISASLGLPGQRSMGGSVSSASVPMSYTARRALAATTPPLTLQERRRNSRRALAASKPNAPSSQRSQRGGGSVPSQPGKGDALPGHAGSGVNSSGRHAKRGMNAASGRIDSPETTEKARYAQQTAITEQQQATPATFEQSIGAHGSVGQQATVDAQTQQLQPRDQQATQGPSALVKRGPLSRAQAPPVSHQVYSSSGFDMIGALARVVLRPNPRIMLGPVDMSCSFTVCDARHPEQPIVYCSDTFCKLTGYSRQEIIGRNCRFLQSPDGRVESGSERYHTDNAAVAHLKQHSRAMSECQASLINYRKNGTPFINLVTVVPIAWTQGHEPAYLVGFQVDLVEQPSAVLERAADGSYIVNYSTQPEGMPQPRIGPAELLAPPVRDMDQEAAAREVAVGKDILSIISGGKDDANQWARIMLQHSQDLIHVLSLKGTFLYVSPSVERLLGWKPEELIGKSISDFCHPSDVVPVFRELKDSTSNASINAAAKRSFRSEGVSNRATKGGVGQGGPEVNLLMRMKRKDSSFAWIESKGKLHLEQGKGRKVVISSGRTRPVYNLPWAPVRDTAGGEEPSFWTKVSTDGLVLSATDGASKVVDGVDSASLYGRHLQQMVNNEALPALLEGLRGVQVMTVTHKMWNIVDQPVWVTSTLYPSAVVPGSHTVPTVFVKMTLAKREAMPKTNIAEPAPVKPTTPETGLEDGAVPSSSVFGELSAQRSSSHIYELHSLKHVNRRLKEDVRAAQRRVGNKIGVRQWQGEPPAGAQSSRPTAPLRESFVENLNKESAAGNRPHSGNNSLLATPMRSSSSSTPSGNGHSSSEQSIFDHGATGGGSASEETVPTTRSSSSGDASDFSGGENKKAP